MVIKTFEPLNNGNLKMTNEQLYAKIRAGFVSKGTSLNKWCKQSGYHRQNAYAAIMGEWTGEKATELLNLLIVESGVDLQIVINNPSKATHLAIVDLGIDLNMDCGDSDHSE